MPLYSYTCTSCALKFSRVSQPDQAVTVCKGCGGPVSPELSTGSLIETPGNVGRKLAKQVGQKNKQLSHKHNLRT